MRPRLPFADVFVVTARDGTVLACWLEVVEDKVRWVIVDSNRGHYFGPLFMGHDTLEEVQELVADWWATKQPGAPGA
jgi:hypothetical protein